MNKPPLIPSPNASHKVNVEQNWADEHQNNEAQLLRLLQLEKEFEDIEKAKDIEALRKAIEYLKSAKEETTKETT